MRKNPYITRPANYWPAILGVTIALVVTTLLALLLMLIFNSCVHNRGEITSPNRYKTMEIINYE